MPQKTPETAAQSKYPARPRGGEHPPIPTGLEGRPHKITMRSASHLAFAALLPIQRGHIVERGLKPQAPKRRPSPQTTVKKGRRNRDRADGTFGTRNPRVEVTIAETSLARRIYPIAREGGLPELIRKLLDAATAPTAEGGRSLFEACMEDVDAAAARWENIVSSSMGPAEP